MYTLEGVNPITDDDVNKFLRVLLSLDLTALNFEYSEEMITEHLRNHHMVCENFKVNVELPLTYESLSHYKMSYLPLILYDGWAQIVEGYNSSHYGLLEMFCRKIDAKSGPEFITIFLKVLVPSADVHFDKFALENWIIILQQSTNDGSSARSPIHAPDGDSNNQMTLGFVHAFANKINVYGDQLSAPKLPIIGRYDEFSSLTEVEYVIKIAKNEKNLKLIADQKQFFIQPVYYFRPSIRYVETLSLMNLKDSFYRSFLNPDLEVSSLDFCQQEGFRFFDSESFNSQQKNAIVGCFNAVQQPYSTNKTVMIQGPPGTGKTHTLVGIVKNMFINCSDSKSNPLRILICAPSNGAIDEIALRLIRDRDFLRKFKEHKLRLVRIGQCSQVHPKVKTYLLNQLVEQNYQFCQRCRPKSEIRDELLINANVILSTLNSVQLNCMNIFRKENISKAIRCVIVDEASQSTEPELLMPLIYPISKLILIGDHLQLPATVISRVALRMGYGRSLFERLYRHFESMETSNPMLTLCRQFRMINPICAFPSMHFYKGLLETPKGIGQNPRIPIQPYYLFDVVNASENTTSNLVNASKYNVVEADFIFKLILVILDKLGYHASGGGCLCELPERLHVTIGVITFYRGQKQELLKRLEAFQDGVLLKHIDVNTVDAFQGQERDIVILSCVRAFDRTGDNNSVGFVRSQQRMNVALTRAKSVLFICIHAKSFIDVPRWQQLLIDAQLRNRYVRMTSMVTNEALKRKISL